jgi:hypothetical protein
MSKCCLRRCALIIAILSGSAAAAQDDIELEGISVIGNKELPKALYIVPWKRPELGDPQGRPLGSLLDEALTPIDREVFLRELEYYDESRASQ